jgi:hypothetical protein
MKRQLITAVLFAFASFATASHAKNSAIRTSIAKKNNVNTIKINTAAKPGLKANFDGPWKLKLTPSKGVKVAKRELTKSDLDQLKSKDKNGKPMYKPSFTVKASGKGTMGYTATVFVCKEDECFREQHTGTVLVK